MLLKCTNFTAVSLRKTIRKNRQYLCLMLLFFGLYTVGKILIHEIRETPVLPAVPADIFFAGEKYAAEENIVFVFGFVILHILCSKILVGEV